MGGSFTRRPPPTFRCSCSAGSTLALGVADLTGDGLLDLMVSQDSIALPGGQPTMPGGVYKRCNPSQGCRYQPYAVGQGEAAFRNLMGSGVLHIDGHGEFVYYSDIDTNQLIQVSDEPAQNRALNLALRWIAPPRPIRSSSTHGVWSSTTSTGTVSMTCSLAAAPWCRTRRTTLPYTGAR